VFANKMRLASTKSNLSERLQTTWPEVCRASRAFFSVHFFVCHRTNSKIAASNLALFCRESGKAKTSNQNNIKAFERFGWAVVSVEHRHTMTFVPPIDSSAIIVSPRPKLSVFFS
jgi:hypothetical protein